MSKHSKQLNILNPENNDQPLVLCAKDTTSSMYITFADRLGERGF